MSVGAVYEEEVQSVSRARCLDSDLICRQYMLRRFFSLTSLQRTMSSAAQHPPTSAPPVTGKSFRIALAQLGGMNEDKSHNILLAREQIKKAAQGDDKGRPHMIVLPVSWTAFEQMSSADPSSDSVSACRKYGIRRTQRTSSDSMPRAYNSIQRTRKEPTTRQRAVARALR